MYDLVLIENHRKMGGDISTLISWPYGDKSKPTIPNEWGDEHPFGGFGVNGFQALGYSCHAACPVVN
jgi:hypothetical protein